MKIAPPGWAPATLPRPAPLARPASLTRLACLAPLALLAGCDMVVMAPSGDVAVQQRDLILIATGLMLLIIVPVMALTVLFAWKYRRAADAPDYDPDWDHSTGLELLIWSAPLLIIICLGAVTWSSTHLLDPYRAISRLDAKRAVPANAVPLDVQVVAMDWKWLFFYPQYGIATVNELAAPVDRPIRFSITSTTVMTSFYVPALAGMIYAMPGMETRLNAVINRPGTFEGFAAHYNGAGFSDMRFRFLASDPAGFDRWVAGVRAARRPLTQALYLQLERPSERVAPMRFASTPADLYRRIANLCARPGQRCMSDVMMVDARGGGGKESARNTAGLRHDGAADRGALQKAPEDKGSSPHFTEPAGKSPPGTSAAPKGGGKPGNRDLT